MFAQFLRFRQKNTGDFHLKIQGYQRKIVDFIKERRTIKLLHLLRNYSALVVVISSAILVTATNLASESESGGFLFGQWNNEQGYQGNKSVGQFSRKNDLAFVPLAKASAAVDIEAEEEDKQDIIDGQAMMAAANQVLKDPEEDGGVKMYEVKNGDTVSAIAARYNITVNTILWANDIENVDEIMPGDKIFILPVAGVTYVVQKNDNLDYIAKKYKAEKDKIIAFNDLTADGEIKEGQQIVIPGGEKEVPRRVAADDGLARRSYATPTGGEPVISGWKKLDGKAGNGHKFPYGYCTWYVAQKRYVPWGGNAGTWLYRAKSAGYKTGKAPQVGAIIVTTESWWGHVAIVEKVSGGTVTVSEMNYKGWGKKSSRTIATNSRVIKGYIY